MASPPEKEVARTHRQFKLPPNMPTQKVNQTLVQLDLPPDIKLKQEMQLPNALLWTETAPMRKQFVAPPLRKLVPKVAQSLAAAPALTSPNLETNPAELNIASIIPADVPHFVRPPSVASPVSHEGQEPAKEIPQIGVAASSQPSAANIISLPANPLRASTLLVLPPANQIAASDAGNANSLTGTGTATGAGGHELVGTGSGAGVSTGSNSTGPAAGNGSELRAGTGEGTGMGTGASGSGSAAAGNGRWTASGSAGTLDVGKLAGTTRIDLPKQGQFGVVVLGSATSAAYPESAGALSGKVVYTVYLKVGLRKSWILQYCLSKAPAHAGVPSQSTVPVAAPWPFLIMRPDEWSASDPDYIIVHGDVNEDGKFERLKMLFPGDLEKKELILKSLNLWAFRPASRDGVPVTVEVLLIIPREAE